MAEFVIVGGNTIKCSSITTGIDSISFTIPTSEGLDFDETYELFQNATSLQTAGEQLVDGELVPKVHGTYPMVELDFGGRFAKTGAFKFDMHIPNEVERRLAALEAAQKALAEDQEVQNGAIEEIGNMIGG